MRVETVMVEAIQLLQRHYRQEFSLPNPVFSEHFVVLSATYGIDKNYLTRFSIQFRPIVVGPFKPLLTTFLLFRY